MILIYSRTKFGGVIIIFFFTSNLWAVDLFCWCLIIEECKRESERQHRSFIQRIIARNLERRFCTCEPPFGVLLGTEALLTAHSEVFLLSRFLSLSVSVFHVGKTPAKMQETS